jgi:phosphoadenosine phosphosulfate reductase
MNMFGRDMVENAIERIRTFEPPEGYFLAYSGGKDSVVIKALADMADVKYDAHYQLTSVDPPELVAFVKSQKDVIIDVPRYPSDYKNPKLAGKPKTMWNLIPEKGMPPTRLMRYCCTELKESAGAGRFVITGVRKAESIKRSKRGGVELAEKKSHRAMNYDPDNPDQELIHICRTYARRTLNPIFDWSTEEVWEFIRDYKIPYCKLYDEGFKRLGCIGCPMAGEHRETEFERYPKFKRAYIHAFQRMIDKREEEGKLILEGENAWLDGESVFEWWMPK